MCSATWSFTYFNIGKEQGHVDIFEKSACRGFIIRGFFDIAQTKITVIKLVLVMKVRRGIIWAKKDKGTGVGLNKGWLRIIHSICFWWTVFYSIGRSRSRKLLWRRRRRKGLWRICGVGFLCLQRVQYIYNIPILDKNPYIYIYLDDIWIMTIIITSMHVGHSVRWTSLIWTKQMLIRSKDKIWL